MKKYITLVTGINGNIGGNIFRYLSQTIGFDVWGLSKTDHKYLNDLEENQKGKVLIVDLLRPIKNQLLRVNFDYIIHCAAVTPKYKHKANSSYIDNKKIIMSLINFAKDLKSRPKLIFFSSGSVYRDYNSCIETKLAQPKDGYGISMLKAENYLIKNYNNFVILRLFYPYGFDKYTAKDNFIDRLITSVKNDHQIFSNTDPKNIWLNPIHMDDINKVLIDIIKTNKNKIISNLSSTEAISYYELIEFISKKVGKKSRIIIDSNFSKPFFANTKKMEELFQNINFSSFYDGINKIQL